MNDEIIVKIGSDLTGVGAGLRSLKNMVKETTHNIRESFSHAFEHLAAPLSVAGAIGVIEKTFSKVQDITRQSESLGVSNGFVQSIQNAGSVSGLASSKIEKMLDTFAKTLPAGSDVEESFYKVADGIAAVEDPATRARMATDAFGKSGVQMIAVLSKGRDGVKELAAGFAQLTESEIEAVEAAHTRIEQVESKLTVWAGKAMGFIQTAGTIIGAKLGGADPSDVLADEMREKNQTEESKKTAQHDAAAAAAAAAKRLELEKIVEATNVYNHHLAEIELKSKTTSFEDKKGILERQAAEERQAAIDATNTLDRITHLSKIADIHEKIKELEESHTAEIKKQKEHVADLAANLNHARRAEHEAFEDRSRFSVQELAGQGMGKYNAGNGRWETNAERTAVDITRLEARAKDARNWGNIGMADELTNRALELRKSLGAVLTSSESDPIGKLHEATLKAETHLSKMLELMAGNGIAIADDDDNPGL